MRKEVCKKIEWVGDTLEAANLFTDEYAQSTETSLKEGVAELQTTVGQDGSGYPTQEDLDSHTEIMEQVLDRVKKSHMDAIDVIIDSQYEAFGCSEFEENGRIVFFDPFLMLGLGGLIGGRGGGSSSTSSSTSSNTNTNNIVVQNTIPSNGSGGYNFPYIPFDFYPAYRGGPYQYPPMENPNVSSNASPNAPPPGTSGRSETAVGRTVSPNATIDSVSTSTAETQVPEEPDETINIALPATGESP